MVTPRANTYNVGSGQGVFAGRGLPAWVPQTLWESSVLPVTNTLDSQILNGVWSFGQPGAAFAAFSGGVYVPWIGRYGAILVFGGGHSAGNDNSVMALLLDTLTWVRLSNPTDLVALGKWVDYSGGGYGIDLAFIQNVYDYFAARGPLASGWNTPSNSSLWQFGVGQENDNPGEYVDGVPCSIHSYGIPVALPPAVAGDPDGGLLIPVIAAGANTPQISSGWAHLFKLRARTWERWSLNGLDRSVVGYASSYDPTRNIILSAVASNNEFGYLDGATRQWTKLYNNTQWVCSSSGAILAKFYPARDCHVVVMINGGIQVQYMPGGTISGAARTNVSWTNGSPPPLTSAQSLVSVPPRGSLFLWGFEDPDAFYEITATATLSNPWTWTRRPFTGPGRFSLMSPLPAEAMYDRMGFCEPAGSIVCATGERGTNNFGGRAIAVRVH